MRAMTGASASWCDLTRVVRAIGTERCDYACHWHGEVRLCAT